MRTWLAIPFVATLVSAGPAAEPSWRRIESATYEERQKEVAFSGAAERAMLVLPFGSRCEEEPPRFVGVGERIAEFPEPWRTIDRVVSRLPVHDDYLREREARKGDAAGLVDWCLKHGLDDCAEMEASRVMTALDDFQKPEYAALLRRWLPLRDRRTCAWSLPLPVEGEWFVLADHTGHHRIKAWAAYAWDVVRRVNGRSFRGLGRSLEDHYAFGQPVVAQGDGVVVDVDDKTSDNPPGKLGKYDEANGVTVDYGGGVLVDYGHLKQGSAAVKAGDRVKLGQRLGLVGNSGASAAPHLHFTVQDWGFDSIRGRFHGEEKKKDGRWVPFEGRDLLPDTTVRNAPPPAEGPR